MKWKQQPSPWTYKNQRIKIVKLKLKLKYSNDQGFKKRYVPAKTAATKKYCYSIMNKRLWLVYTATTTITISTQHLYRSKSQKPFTRQRQQHWPLFKTLIMTELNFQGRKNSQATCPTQGHYHLGLDDNMKTQKLLKWQPHKNMSNPITHLANFSHKLNFQSYNITHNTNHISLINWPIDKLMKWPEVQIVPMMTKHKANETNNHEREIGYHIKCIGNAWRTIKNDTV